MDFSSRSVLAIGGCEFKFLSEGWHAAANEKRAVAIFDRRFPPMGLDYSWNQACDLRPEKKDHRVSD